MKTENQTLTSKGVVAWEKELLRLTNTTGYSGLLYSLIGRPKSHRLTLLLKN